MNNQFDKIYPVKINFLENPANRRKRAFVEDEELRQLSKISSRVSNINFFEDVLTGKYQENFARPRIGFFCHLVPDELIMALGAQPVRLDCGNSAAVAEGEDVLAGDICPLTKSSFGMFLDKDSRANSCVGLVLAASCDAKRKLGEVLNDFKPVFSLVIPAEQNSREYARLVQREIMRLVKFLEKLLGMRLKRRALKDAINLSRRRTALVRELQEIRNNNPSCMSIRDLFLIVQSSSGIAPLEVWLTETEKAVEELKIRDGSRKNLHQRLVLTGAPILWPNFKILSVVEESGAEIVADTLCSGTQSCFDPVVVDEYGLSGMLRALVLKHIFASICPCFISQTTRINRVLELVETCKADGVVSHSLRLCQLFDVENFRLEQTLRERKIPYLNLRTDYSREDVEQLRVRIEAFLETIQ